MWVLIFIIMMGEGMDASKDIYTPSPVITYDTEQQCHDQLNIWHKGDTGSSLQWQSYNGVDRLVLLSEDRTAVWKCFPTKSEKLLENN